MGGANHKIKLVTARRFCRPSGEVEVAFAAPLPTTYDAGFFT